MKNSKKCKKNACKNNNANSMNEAQLESVQGGMGNPMTLEERDDWALYDRKMPAGLNPGDGARNWMPGDGAKRK